ncbi:rod shape-determining protein [Truepera radiovictrix]|uniref:rod shape-determining protein n=1 Tax=Truepera radiovictrix TaxID=332249 RepID=UPI0002D5E78E|nr:rod shape-determining protein [Truepera radiovictrix]WMT57983.1 rod shape-determining protein [Truepera radiovictrix]
MFRGARVGIDVGTTAVRVCVKGRGVILREPTVVALDKATGTPRAVGRAALQLLGEAPGDVIPVRPLQDGLITEEALLEEVLREVLRRLVSAPRRLLRGALGPSVALCLPAAATPAQTRAALATVQDGGARAVELVDPPLAAALGAGLPVTEAAGCFVADLGGGSTDLAVIALGGVVVGETLRVAGGTFDEAVVRAVRRHHGVLIGERSGEELKRRIGSVSSEAEKAAADETLEVRGRDVARGLPKTVTVSRAEVGEALQEGAARLASAVRRLLETAPAELTADIVRSGLVLTGGGSYLRGLDSYLQTHTGLPVTRAPSAEDCTAVGALRALSCPEPLRAAPRT